MRTWSSRFDPFCDECSRSPEEILGEVRPEKLEEHGWVQIGIDGWRCNLCDVPEGEEEA